MDYRVPSTAGFAGTLRLGAVEVHFGADAVEAAVFDILVDRMLFPQHGYSYSSKSLLLPQRIQGNIFAFQIFARKNPV